MNPLKKLLCGLFVLGGFVSLSGLLHAQESASDLEVMIKAVEETTPLPATNAPDAGNFYSAQHAPGSEEEWPPLPADVLGLPIWPLGDGYYVLDDANVDYAALAEAQTASGGGTRMMNESDFVPTTNELWLQIITVTNGTASLVIHPPWNVTNGVYDLLYCTNLDAPISWQWLLRTDPGQTNLVVPNATDAQGFYSLGAPNDLTANDSLGTNFWIAFLEMNGGIPSLYISSPLASMGTVTFLGDLTNSSVLTVSSCGDSTVNGTYHLTNTSGAEASDGIINGSVYANGTLQVGYRYDDVWVLFQYNSGADDYTWLYDKLDGNPYNASGSDWEIDSMGTETNLPPPTTSGAVLLIESFSLTAGQVTNIVVPVDYYFESPFMANGIIQTNGIEITASQPVSVYGINYEAAATATFTGYPTSLLGTNYCVMARPSFDTGYSEFGIVAIESNTTVTITPSPTADLNGSSGTNAYTETLQQGQTYQINSIYSSDDVTGTRVTANNPIGVFAGANIAYVPDAITASGNPLVQEQLPVNQWGTQALGLSFAGRTNGDSYRVLAAYNDTVITITGNMVTIVAEPLAGPWTVTTSNEVVVVTNQAGGFFDTIVDGSVEFQATKPIQVAQFANGNVSDIAPYGDPCEILLLPTDRYLETNTVVAPTGDFDENYLNIIVPQSAIMNTLVDGSHVATNNFVAIGSSGYYGARLSVTSSASHIVTSSQPVGVEVYGFGYYDAYGYFGGIVK